MSNDDPIEPVNGAGAGCVWALVIQIVAVVAIVGACAFFARWC